MRKTIELALALLFVLFCAQGARAQLNVTPGGMNFFGVVGGLNPPTQAFTVTGASGTSYTVTTLTADGAKWLTATPASATGNGVITVSVNLALLTQAGAYAGRVTIDFGGGVVAPLPVNLAFQQPGITLPFTAVAGGPNPPLQLLTITTPAANTTWITAVSTLDGANWLSVTPSTGTGSQNVKVNVDISKLKAGKYLGQAILTIDPANTNQQTGALITLVVSPTGGAAISMTKISGDFQSSAAGLPLPQPFVVDLWDAANGAGLPAAPTPVTFTVSSGSGQFANGQSSIVVTTGGGTASATLTLGTKTGVTIVNATSGSVSPFQTFVATAVAGAANKIVIANAPTAAVPGVTLPIAVRVTDAFGNGVPGATVTFTPPASAGGSVSVASTTSNATGLATTGWTLPASVTTATSVTLAVAVTGGPTLNVPVLLTPVAQTLTVYAAPLIVTATQGGTAPALPVITLTAVPALAPITWSATASVIGDQTPWLAVGAASGTANPTSTLQATINMQGLSAGTLNGTIRITSAALPNGTLDLPVTLNVVAASSPPKLALSRTSIWFSAAAQSPQSQTQTVHVANTGGGTLTFTATTVNPTVNGSSVNVLAVSPASGSAPADLTLTINPIVARAGNYTSEVIVTASDGSTQVISVYLSVALNALVVDNPVLSFVWTGDGSDAPSRTLRVSSAGSPVAFTAQLNLPPGQSWAGLNSSSGTTPATIQVVTDPASLPPGIYECALNISVPGANPANATQVAVVLTVKDPTSKRSAFPFVTNTTGSITSIWTTPNSPAPNPGILPGAFTIDTAFQIAGAAGINYSYDAATRNPTVTVETSQTVNGSCIQLGGTVLGDPALYGYQYCAVGSALIHSATPVLIVTQPQFQFNTIAGLPVNLQAGLYDVDGTPLPAQHVRVSFSSGEPDLILTDTGSGIYSGVWTTLATGNVILTFAAPSVTSGASGAAGAVPSVIAVPSAAAGASAVPSVIAEGVVSAPSTQLPSFPAFAIGGAVNAASFTSGGPLAPGSLASVFGANLAPSALQASATPLPLTLNLTSLQVSGVPAPLIFVSPGQINFQVPFEVAGLPSVTLTLSNATQIATLGNVPLSDTAPGIFLAGGTQGAITHQDGSLANAAKPASGGEVLLLYGTGLGPVSNPPATGALAGGALANTLATPTVTVGGQAATVGFAGLAPGFAGLYQVNFVVPIFLGTGAVPVVVQSGFAVSNVATIVVK